MKQIEDIERMTPEELEAASEGISVPAGLQERIRESLAASELSRPEVCGQSSQEADTPVLRNRRISRFWIPFASLAAAAAVAAVLLVPRLNRAPIDTYSDPYLAYAQVEATFRLISDKMSAGVELAGEANTTAQKPLQLLQKITEK